MSIKFTKNLDWETHEYCEECVYKHWECTIEEIWTLDVTRSEWLGDPGSSREVYTKLYQCNICKTVGIHTE